MDKLGPVAGATRFVSVVTAVHAPSVRFLPAAYESLATQEMPAGWDWQWLVQEDGTEGHARVLLPNDDRISYATGRPLGPGIARTYALARAVGELIKVLDSDDVLTPGALARDIAAVTGSPDIGWATCRALDLMPDGSTVAYRDEPPAGPIARGDVLRHWVEHDHRSPVHPATLCIRRDLLLSLGGWMALPASEDTGLLLAADAVATGYFTAEAGLYYRKWPGQLTAHAAHIHPMEQHHRNSVIEARARLLAATFGDTWTFTHEPIA